MRGMALSFPVFAKCGGTDMNEAKKPRFDTKME